MCGRVHLHDFPIYIYIAGLLLYLLVIWKLAHISFRFDSPHKMKKRLDIFFMATNEYAFARSALWSRTESLHPHWSLQTDCEVNDSFAIN